MKYININIMSPVIGLQYEKGLGCHRTPSLGEIQDQFLKHCVGTVDSLECVVVHDHVERIAAHSAQPKIQYHKHKILILAPCIPFLINIYNKSILEIIKTSAPNFLKACFFYSCWQYLFFSDLLLLFITCIGLHIL